MLNMTPFVSVLILLLAVSRVQVTPVPYSGDEQVPYSGEEQVPYSGDELDETQTEDISIHILTQNNNSAEFLLEGDLLPPKTRNAMKCWHNTCRWPKGQDGKVSVAYTVSSEFSGNERQLISTALREIESKTCIRFVPHRSESDYISVENQFGCFSSLGKQGGRQELSLNRRGCVYKGIIQHEFNHALGFIHEHNRSDRDKYVRINWDNIDQNMAYNFNKADTDNQDTPYDYNSVMHYGRTAFSKNGGETITPLSQANIGQTSGMSQWDIKRINLFYSC
uniref:Metalloendopeptidase n=1 Tax=Neogobius melanostomus TaxID=47308 RepID=A0A8C6TKT7_9GOBI